MLIKAYGLLQAIFHRLIAKQPCRTVQAIQRLLTQYESAYADDLKRIAELTRTEPVLTETMLAEAFNLHRQKATMADLRRLLNA